MINCKLRLFTPRSSHGAKEMAPKSQLCACSFQDSLWQKNWALEQIREFPDTFGYVWTAENDSNTLRVDAYSDLSNVAKNPCIHAISIQELKGVSVKREPGSCGTLRIANGIVWNLIANRKVGTDKIFIKKKGDTP